MTVQELKDKQNSLITRCDEIVNLCKSEVREMTKEEEDEFNANKEEIKALKNEKSIMCITICTTDCACVFRVLR